MYRFEEALKKINKDFIQLSDNEIRLHDEIIDALLNTLTKRMSEIDELFAEMYIRPFYGGSYYDGLKITKADEYDLDLLLRIPKICEPIITLDTTYPGHVTVKLNNMVRLSKQPEGPSYRTSMERNKKVGNRNQKELTGSSSFENFMKKKRNKRKLFSFLDQENYLNAAKVRSWMESLITKTLNEYHDNKIDLRLSMGCVTFQVTMKKSGPANTFHVNGEVDSIKVEMDIDYVPCFVFNRDKYPIDVWRFEVDLRQDYFIVPKTPKNEDRVWRLSFQEQERALINGKNRLKPVLKLLKRLRDNLGHDVIASYYLKTLFLWKCREVDNSFWSNNSLSTVFMTMLESYRDHLLELKIKYYWDHNLNLLGNLNPDTLVNITGCISRIIAEIKIKNNDDVIYKYFSKSRKGNPSPEETSFCDTSSSSTREKFALGEGRKSTSPLEEASSCDTSSLPTWAAIALGGIAVTGVVAAGVVAVRNNRREEERRQRQQRNEHENNEEDSKCSLM